MKLSGSASIALLFILSASTFNILASGMVSIPAGPFQMGCSAGDRACDNDEGAAGGASVSVPEFRLDTHEVTVNEYQQCIEAGKCTRPKDHQRNQYCNIGATGRENHPANCVEWQDAVDYCRFAGKRLPNEAEWEKAARAGSLSAYPWGQTVSCKHAILDDKVTTGSVSNEGDAAEKTGPGLWAAGQPMNMVYSICMVMPANGPAPGMQKTALPVTQRETWPDPTTAGRK
jgi:formylglycine-generating enzyme required for sulfatase activity